MRIDYQQLKDRLGEDLLRRRVLKQSHHEAQENPQRKYLIDIQKVEKPLSFLFKLLGLYKKGRKRATSIEIVNNEIVANNIPHEFEGFRLLQITDLHLDIDKALRPAIESALKGLNYDLCVITGDFRSKTLDAYHTAIEETIALSKHIHTPIYAVLGNHDFLEMVPELEQAGIQFLINENINIRRGAAQIFLAGIDDPNYYQTHDITRASQGIPPEAYSILLSHSPETFAEAAAAGFSALLAGHTHGGQICLPGGIPIINNSGGCSREKIAGAWKYRQLQGYTSKGTGCCGIPIRLNCPPEITIHTLRKASS